MLVQIRLICLLIGTVLLLELCVLTTGFKTSRTILRSGLSKARATTLQASSSGGGEGNASPKTIAVLGASGYTGAELMRILVNHPGVEVKVITADRSAGKPFKDIYPQFAYKKVTRTLSRTRT